MNFTWISGFSNFRTYHEFLTFKSSKGRLSLTRAYETQQLEFITEHAGKGEARSVPTQTRTSHLQAALKTRLTRFCTTSFDVDQWVVCRKKKS